MIGNNGKFRLRPPEKGITFTDGSNGGEIERASFGVIACIVICFWVGVDFRRGAAGEVIGESVGAGEGDVINKIACIRPR